MARTRTSDHTFRPRHAKRLVYACSSRLVLTLALVQAAGALVQGVVVVQAAGRRGVGLWQHESGTPATGVNKVATRTQTPSSKPLPSPAAPLPVPPLAVPCVACQILSLRADQIGSLPA